MGTTQAGHSINEASAPLIEVENFHSLFEEILCERCNETNITFERVWICEWCEMKVCHKCIHFPYECTETTSTYLCHMCNIIYSINNGLELDSSKITPQDGEIIKWIYLHGLKHLKEGAQSVRVQK